MKYLTDYVQDAQTVLFDKTKTFFAFSNDQFNEGKTEGIEKYTSCGAGMYCPSVNVKELIAGLDAIQESGIKQDIIDNGINGIIKRELANHEAYYTYDIDDTVESLEQYKITREQVQAVFNIEKHLVDA